MAANESDPLSQRDGGVEAAKALGLEVVSSDVTYQVDTTDFTPVLLPVIKTQPDLLVLSGVAPANAPQLIRSARELGYEGLISTETAQDATVLEQGAGELANGFISVGGASTPEIASDQMKEFVDRYTKMFGEYNDELNTKVYALQYILDTLKANPAAIDNVEEFKKTMDTFSAPNPYLKSDDATLHYVGATSFGQKRQLAVPLVVNVYKDGKFETLFVARSRLILPTPGPAPAGPPSRGVPLMEQIIVNGLYLGASYALIALGLTLIFALMNVLNFAHGQMYVLGGFVTYTVYAQLGLPFVVGLLASAVTLAIIGGALRALPLRARSSAAPSATSRPCCSPPASPSSSTR